MKKKKVDNVGWTFVDKQGGKLYIHIDFYNRHEVYIDKKDAIAKCPDYCKVVKVAITRVK